MPRVIFFDSAGSRQEVDVPAGWSLMEGARRAGIRGIDADCGGNCACGTCHVYVDAPWAAQLTPRGETETAMLNSTTNVLDTSRLSCQVTVTESLDGMEVHVAPSGL